MSTESCQNGKLIIFDWEGTLGLRGGELVPGTRATLELLKQHGFDMAIATSMGTASLNERIEEHDLGSFFNHLQTSEMGYPKPDPQMLVEVLTATAHTANDAVMVGDCSYDLIMAENTDIKAIGVLTGNDNEQRLLAETPNATVLNTINDLPHYFNIIPDVFKEN